ncbi:hypothetical protein ABIB57_003089 [Devosia sp. UYZn731]|uniref:hypothetical protein n=1 Tax=Devosia sp. UYZn731 TaxID=3156345 RepID=UPI003390F659
MEKGRLISVEMVSMSMDGNSGGVLHFDIVIGELSDLARAAARVAVATGHNVWPAPT